MKDTDLAWLAGIMEGEGTFAIYHQVRKTVKNGPNGQLRACISLTNTDPALMNKAYEVFLSMGVEMHVHEYKNKKGSTRPVYDMQTAQYSKVKLVCETLLPFLYGEKNAKVKMILRFVNKRLEKGKLPYDEDDWSLFQEYRSSETLRKASYKEMKIKSAQGESHWS